MQFHFSTSGLLALAASFALVAAQNAFTMAVLPATIHAGTPFNITWQATTPGDVSIWLVQGPSSNTKYVATVAANITNSGQFSWTPSSSLQSGSGYALEIVSDSNPFITNWSGQFALDGGNGSVDDASPASASSASTTASDASATAASSSTASGSTASKTTMATMTSSSASATSSSASTSAVPTTAGNAAGRVGASASALVVFVAALFVAL